MLPLEGIPNHLLGNRQARASEFSFCAMRDPAPLIPNNPPLPPFGLRRRNCKGDGGIVGDGECVSTAEEWYAPPFGMPDNPPLTTRRFHDMRRSPAL